MHQTRRLTLLLLATLPLAAAIAAPLAAAQDQPAPAPSEPTLVLDPPMVDAPAGEANATIVLRNPMSTAQRYHLTSESADGVRAVFGRENVSVAAGSVERVMAKVRVQDTSRGAEQVVTIVATPVSGQAAAADPAPTRPAPPLRADLTLRLVPRATATASPPPQTAPAPTAQGELHLSAPELRVGPGLSAQGSVLVRNVGREPFVPELTTNAGPALRFEFATFPALKPGEQVDVPFGVTLVADAPEGPRRIEVQAVGFAAPAVVLRVDVVPAAQAPPTTAASADELPQEAIVVAAALAGVAGLGTTAWLTRRLWWPLLLGPLAPLYTRLRPSKLLDHPLRAKLVDIVRAQPGIAFGELARALEIAPGQLTHHARMLEKGRVLFSSPDGQTRRFYLVAEGRVAPVAPLAERALALVRASPRRASDVARELGVSRQALHYHLKQLAARGAIVTRQDGRDLWLEAVGEPQPPSAPAGVART